MGRYYYDIRYPLLLAVALLQSYVDDQQTTSSSSFVMNEVKMVIFLVLLAAFLLTTIRIQLFWCSSSSSAAEEEEEQQQQLAIDTNTNDSRRVELRFGRPALSVPLTLSLIITLFLPPSTLWISAYLLIFLMSCWSDSIHSFFTNFSYGQERLLLLPVVLAHDMSLPSQQPALQLGIRTEESPNA